MQFAKEPKISDPEVLFSEGLSRYVITVGEGDYDEVAQLLNGVTFARLGRSSNPES